MAPLRGLTGETATSVYNAATNRITPFSYDQRGNVTAVPGRTTTYDGENRQITAVANSVSSTYAYDGEGRRVSKTVGGVTTVFVYDAIGLAAEYGPAPTETGRQYFTADHLGSTRLVTGAGGAVTKTLDYLPFGEELNVACLAAPGGVKFTGQMRDQETCEDYFGARYMSSAQGRFLSPDEPFADQDQGDPQSWNLYGYVRNNPLNSFDPSGRCSQVADGYIDGDKGGKLLFKGACANGSIGEEKHTVSANVTVDGDEGRLLMLAGIYDRFSAHGIAQLTSDIGLAAMAVISPRTTAMVQCAATGALGGNCDKTGVVMAMIQNVKGIRLGGKVLDVNPNVPLRSYLAGARLARAEKFPEHLLDLTADQLKQALESGQVTSDQVKK